MDYTFIRNFIPTVQGIVANGPGRWHGFSDLLVSMYAALAFMVTLLTGTLGGVECSGAIPSMKAFVNAVCSKMPFLKVPIHCWRRPNRLQMWHAKVEPIHYGMFDCVWDYLADGNQVHTTSVGPISTNGKPDKARVRALIRAFQYNNNYWYEYYQHGLSSIWLLVVALAMSTSTFVWSALERGLMTGLTGTTVAKLIMKDSTEFERLRERIGDYIEDAKPSRTYTFKYFFALSYDIFLQWIIFEATCMFLPEDGYRYFGLDMLMDAMYPTVDHAYTFDKYTLPELHNANGTMATSLMLFPAAGKCQMSLQGFNGQYENRAYTCTFNHSRILPFAYCGLWWAFVHNFIWKCIAMAIFLSKFFYLPMGYALRRLNIHHRASFTDLTSAKVKAIVDKLCFSQVFLLEMVGTKMDDAAYGELLNHIYNEHIDDLDDTEKA